MDKYVSVNKLKAKIISGEPVLFSEATQHEIFFLLESEPSEDVEPVIHAHWIREFLTQTGCYECSSCRRYSTLETNYCGSCGAKMDEEKNEVTK